MRLKTLSLIGRLQDRHHYGDDAMIESIQRTEMAAASEIAVRIAKREG
jgi:hypothetical protein